MPKLWAQRGVVWSSVGLQISGGGSAPRGGPAARCRRSPMPHSPAPPARGTTTIMGIRSCAAPPVATCQGSGFGGQGWHYKSSAPGDDALPTFGASTQP